MLPNISNSYMDKSSWSHGEWNHEPDFLLWFEEKFKSYSMIVRGDRGNLAGYIGLTSDHPFYKITYMELIDYEIFPKCHWGITWSNFKEWTDEAYQTSGLINHKEEFEKVWWIGFDCAHAHDLFPKDKYSFYSTYRNINYAKENINSLHEQFNGNLIKDYYYELGIKKAQIENKMNKLLKFKLDSYQANN